MAAALPPVLPILPPLFPLRRAPIGAVWVLVLTLSGALASAQTTRTWDGGGVDNNWATAGNWSSNDVADTTAEAALFTNDPVGQTKLTPNLAADVTIGQLQYSATAPSYTITGTGTSTLFLHPTASYGGVAVSVASGAADQSITAAEVEFYSSQTWDIGGTTTLLVTGTIEDAPSPDYALTKNGTGTLVFTGDVRYDGPTTINGGALIMSFSNTSMLSSLTVNAGLLRGTTSVNALGSSNARNHITLAGGALELANNTGQTFGSTSRRTTLTGNATIRSDRLTAGAGVTHTLGLLTVGGQTLSVAPGAAVTSGTAGMNFGITTFTAAGSVLDVASGANLTLGELSGNFTSTKQGSGQLTLNTAANANRTSAGVTLADGTLELAINTSVNAHNTTISGPATVVSNRSTAGAGVTHTFGPLAIGAQTLSVTPGTNATSGTAGVTFGATTLSGNATFAVGNSGSAGALVTLGAIGQTGGARSLTKSGSGTLLLNGAGNYTGGTTLAGGTLTLGVTNALGSGGFTFAGGTLHANNTSDSSIGALALNANSTLNLSPGGTAATLTFAGVSGTASGLLTITGWSGVAGSPGTDDKVIFSGGTTPDADFLEHLQFDLGGGNIVPAALHATGEIFPLLDSGLIIVPDVTGQNAATATATLEELGLTVSPSIAFSSSVPAGFVISQDPTAGIEVEEGTSVALVISLGPEPVAPTVVITAPIQGTELGAPATFTVTASADGVDDAIAQVEFFRNNASLGVDTTAPYSVDVTNLGIGTHVFTAVATDTQTLMSTSAGVTVLVVADTDDDGMPDAWELAHGLDPDDPADGDLDLDGDGVSNRDEYVFGTLPGDATSRTTIQSLGPSGDGGYTLVFTTLLERTYTILRTTDWVTWTPVATDLPGTGSPIEHTDHPGAGTGIFYRVEVDVATP